MTKDKQHPVERYAQQVRSKGILTCELVQLAVERYYRDLDNSLDATRKPYINEEGSLNRTFEVLEAGLLGNKKSHKSLICGFLSVY